MFEEDCCLQCGNPGLSDARIYCSDECRDLDASSPSISTASSAMSSPVMQPYPHHAHTDVPPFSLMPGAPSKKSSSALSRSHYHAYRYSSSKSSISAMWYEDDDGDAAALTLDSDTEDPTIIHPFANAAASTTSPALRPTGLSYARRPSSTNTHSTIPLLHRRTSSVTTNATTSASASPAEELDAPFTHDRQRLSQPLDLTFNVNMNSEVSSSTPTSGTAPSRPHRHDTLKPSFLSTSKPAAGAGTVSTTSKKHRTRNRASLPAYFSLLQLGSPGVRAPKATSAGVSVSLSPTTPTLAGPAVDGVHVLGVSVGAGAGARARLPVGRSGTPSDSDSERERGRPRAIGAGSRSRSRSRSRGDRMSAQLDGVRGRRRPHELDGWRGDREWGFGSGRSGLRERTERGRTRER